MVVSGLKLTQPAGKQTPSSSKETFDANGHRMSKAERLRKKWDASSYGSWLWWSQMNACAMLVGLLYLNSYIAGSMRDHLNDTENRSYNYRYMVFVFANFYIGQCFYRGLMPSEYINGWSFWDTWLNTAGIWRLAAHIGEIAFMCQVYLCACWFGNEFFENQERGLFKGVEGSNPVYERILNFGMSHVAPTTGLLLVVLSTCGQVNATTGTWLKNKWYFVIESRMWCGIYFGLFVIGSWYFFVWNYYMNNPEYTELIESAATTDPQLHQYLMAYHKQVFFFSILALNLGWLACGYMAFFYDIDVYKSWVEDELRIQWGHMVAPKYYYGVSRSGTLKEGVKDILDLAWDFWTSRTFNRQWVAWKADCVWMSLYFSLGTIGSMWMFDAAPGVMSNQECDEKMQKLATVVLSCTFSYFATAALHNTIRNPNTLAKEAQSQFNTQSHNNLRAMQLQQLSQHQQQQGQGQITSMADRKADKLVKRKLKGKSADYGSSSESDDDGDDEWDPKDNSTEAPSASDSAQGYSSSALTSGSSSWQSNHVTVVRQKTTGLGFRGMSEKALTEHLEIEVDKLRAARVWKYMFMPVPVESMEASSGGKYRGIVSRWN